MIVPPQPSAEFLRLAIRQRKPDVRICQMDTQACRMPVHHGFLAETVPDSKHPNQLILEFDRVMLGIHFDSVLSHFGLPVRVVSAILYAPWANVRTLLP